LGCESCAVLFLVLVFLNLGLCYPRVHG